MAAWVAYRGDKGCVGPMLSVRYSRAHRFGAGLARAVLISVASKSSYVRSQILDVRQAGIDPRQARSVTNEKNQKSVGDLCAVPILPLEVEKGCDR